MKRSNGRPLMFFAAAAIFLLAACSLTDQKVPGPPEKVTIVSAMLPDTALEQIASANNYYSQEGLDVTRRSYQIGKQALQDVLDGKADFATVGETPAMLSIMSGDKIAIIATIDTSHKNMAIVARKDRGIADIGDLKGKKIATVSGTIAQFFLDSMLTVNGISRREVKIFNLRPEFLIPALENKDVDAITIWNPLLVGLQKKIAGNGVTFYGEDLYTQFFVVAARQEFIRSRPEAVKRMLKALVRAQDFCAQRPAEAQKIIAEATRADAVLISDIWANNDFKAELAQPLILALEDESRWAIDNGLTKAARVPNYLDFIYADGLKSVTPDAVRILR